MSILICTYASSDITTVFAAMKRGMQVFEEDSQILERIAGVGWRIETEVGFLSPRGPADWLAIGETYKEDRGRS